MESILKYFINLCKKNPLLALITLLLGYIYWREGNFVELRLQDKELIYSQRARIDYLEREVDKKDSLYIVKTEELRNQAHIELKEFFASKEKQYEEQLNLIKANQANARKIEVKSDATLRTVDKVLKQLENGKK